MDRWVSHAPMATIITATREVVDDLLGQNDKNRRIMASHKEWLVEIIKRGEYELTNQGVGIDVDGRLIDGQHRLLAIREADYPPVPLLIVYGLSARARSAVDTGLKRSFTDLLHFAFERPEVTSCMLAAVRAWAIYTGVAGTDKKANRVSAHELLDWYLMTSAALERVLIVPGASKLPAPVLAAFIQRLHRVPEDSRPITFLEQILSGANLGTDSPALRLRNWLTSSKSGSGGRAVGDERFARTATALAAFLEDRTLTKLYRRQNAAELLTTRT